MKEKKPISKHLRFHSLFFKLLIVLISMVVVINLLFVWGVRRAFDQPDSAPMISKHISQYINFTIDSLGIPPDPSKVRDLEKLLSMRIRVVGPDAKVLVGSDLPASELLQPNLWRNRHSHHKIGRYHDQFFILFDRNKYSFSFFTKHQKAFRIRQEILVSVLTLVSLALFFGYFMMHRMLRPLKLLARGMERFGQGDLETELPVKGKDELSRLTQAFNKMAGQIKDQINSKQQLLLDVSHEYRTPLTRMKLAAEFIEEEGVKKKIQNDIKELETMTSEILETARLDNPWAKLNISEFSLADLVEEVVSNSQKNQNDVTINLPSAELRVTTDRERLRLVLRNLVDNAVKYSDSENSKVNIATRPENNRILIQVTDNGPGIPKEELQHVFEPFYRVDKSRQRATGGYGLGLHLCRKIITFLQGDIFIESKQQRGTVVRVLLPLKLDSNSDEA